MPNRIFVDTSFVLALINDRDQYHENALMLSEKFNNSFWITTSGILLEVGNSLAKNFKAEALFIIKAFQNSKTVEIIEVNQELFDKGLDIYEKFDDKDWGLVDCVSFAVMWEREIFEVLTLDDDFKQAGFIVLEN